MQTGRDDCYLSGIIHQFEWSNEAVKPKWNGQGDILGCGLLLNSQGKLTIFFTGNGILMGLCMKIGISSRMLNFAGKQIPINPETGNCLIPTIALWDHVSVEANFGDDSAKPFKYDIKKCPGLVFD
jgi:hypothetical protein